VTNLGFGNLVFWKGKADFWDITTYHYHRLLWRHFNNNEFQCATTWTGNKKCTYIWFHQWSYGNTPFSTNVKYNNNYTHRWSKTV